MLRVKYMVRTLKSCGWKPKFESEEPDGNHSYTEELYDETNEEKREQRETGLWKRRLTQKPIPKIAYNPYPPYPPQKES